MAKSLVIIGAGPKALAIATKSCVLQRLGWRVPRIRVFEMSEIGAHWSGNGGYTNGQQLLCTPPEKDLGFPYRSLFGPAVDQTMLRFSWQSYLVENRKLADWIDDQRSAPMHIQWTEYLRWAAEKCGLQPTIGRVERVQSHDARWQVRYLSSKSHRRRTAQADGIVITGPGEPYKLSEQDDDSRIATGKSFWDQGTFSSFAEHGGNILVIGGGDGAAAVVVALLQNVAAPYLHIHIMTRTGGDLRPRQEGPATNSYYSDPTNWATLGDEERRNFISASDRGAVSAKSLEVIGDARKRGIVKIIKGDAQSAKIVAGEVAVDIGYKVRFYDRVVVATGFNELGFERLFPKNTLGIRHTGRLKTRRVRVAKLLGHDLSVSGVEPKLHLPMLAAFPHGPGLPGLTCLGALADRILQTYVTSPSGRRLAAKILT